LLLRAGKLSGDAVVAGEGKMKTIRFTKFLAPLIALITMIWIGMLCTGCGVSPGPGENDADADAEEFSLELVEEMVSETDGDEDEEEEVAWELEPAKEELEDEYLEYTEPLPVEEVEFELAEEEPELMEPLELDPEEHGWADTGCG
jgi:hypothetical protein